MKKSIALTSLLLISTVSYAVEDIYSLPTEPVTPQKTPIQAVATQANNTITNINSAADRAMNAAGVPPVAGPQKKPQSTPNRLSGTPVNPEQISPENAGQVVSRRDDTMDYLRKQYKSHQMLQMKAGNTQTIPVALGATNRIATSFKHASFTTSVSDQLALIYAEDGFIYVTPGVNSGPIDLIIEENGAPSTAISLYLVPLNVPPVLVELTIGYNKYQQTAANNAIQQYSQNEAETLEKAKQEERERIYAEQPTAGSHVDNVMQLLEVVAKAEIPAGFELLEGNAVPANTRFPCDLKQMLPLYHETKMRLVGAKTVIDIVEVKNEVNGLRSFRDEACMGPGREDVIAVGVLDKATLNTGESTEVYIMRDRTYWERQKRIPKRRRVGGE